MTNMYQGLYSKFIEKNPDTIHMASHSHHYWPDCAITAHNQYALDTIEMVDDKWNHFFENVLPLSQKHIAKIINFNRPGDIAFASNTHELLYRLVSAIKKDSIKILTTTDEFHSASRQFKRLNEEASIEVIQFDINTDEGKSNFLKNITSDIDLIFTSHVFFNSGKVLEWDFIKKINSQKSANTFFCLDAYHSFCAIDVDISDIGDDIFFLSGGYKYAQAGEGMCFMTLPKDCKLRPSYTGWFASFESLENPKEEVEYSQDGMRFAGSTRDFSAHYRFNSVWNMFSEKNIQLSEMTSYVKSLQSLFINQLDGRYKFIEKDINKIGRFISIEFENQEQLLSVYMKLRAKKIITDFRGCSLRFGFAPYITKENIQSIVQTLNSLV